MRNKSSVKRYQKYLSKCYDQYFNKDTEETKPLELAHMPKGAIAKIADDLLSLDDGVGTPQGQKSTEEGAE